MKVLFVCLGNICRSPSALAICQKMCEERQLTDVYLESAGTSAFHEGSLPDARMIKHAQRRGYNLKSRSRQLVPDDFSNFDFILAMDDMNLKDIASIQQAAPPSGPQARVLKLTDYRHKVQSDHVPDPYYGGETGFERVLDILEDCLENFMKRELLKS